MLLNKAWGGLKQIANGDYVLEGDLNCNENLEINLDDRLIVRGNVTVKGSIIVSRTLIAGWGIEAGEGIEAKTFIHSEKRIFAGVSVYHTSQNCKKTIRCAELRKGEICFGDLVITEPEKPAETVMTIAEIEAKLNVKNLKIVKE